MAGDYLIWHNPRCSTSRFVLAVLRDAGLDPQVRDYVKNSPSADEIRQALDGLGVAPRDLLRRKQSRYDELGLSRPDLTDDALIHAMADHPILIQRPVVFSPRGARLCRPKEAVFDLVTQACA